MTFSYAQYPYREAVGIKIKRGIWLLFAFILCAVMVSACSRSTTTVKATSPSPGQTQANWLSQKIGDFTKNTFRFVEEFKIDQQQDSYTITLRFVPEVGSAPAKEDIYRSMAEYAWSIHRFFPEVHRYEFHVLWDEKTKQDAIEAVLEENEVKQLDSRFYDVKMSQQAQPAVSWRTIFTTITESATAKKWHDKETGA